MFNIIYLEVGHTSVEELLSGIYFEMESQLLLKVSDCNVR